MEFETPTPPEAETKQPTFPDGELDLWPSCKASLQRCDQLSNSEYAAQLEKVERERGRFFNLLNQHASQIGCAFTLTRPEHVNEVNGGSNDIWAHALEQDVVQIPRYVLEKRPSGREYILFRKEIPATHILVNLAHELSHLERRRIDPDTYQTLFKGKAPRGERYKVVFTTEIRKEEMATDEHAFALLLKLGIPITPALFVAQIPRNDKMPGYREELLAKLERSAQQQKD